MAQIVCIDTGTLDKDVNEIDDIVEIQDDDVALTGSGYVNYKIIKVEGRSKFALRLMFKHPEQNRAVKITSGKWCFMEEKEVWKNTSGKWCDLINRPNYAFTMKDVTESDRTSLADKNVELSEKDTILAKVTEKIHLDVLNNVEVADLNE